MLDCAECECPVLGSNAAPGYGVDSTNRHWLALIQTKRHSHESMLKRLPGNLTSLSCEWWVFVKNPILGCSYSTKRAGTEGNIEVHEYHHAIRSGMALLRTITARCVRASTASLQHRDPSKIPKWFYKQSSRDLY